MAHLFNLVQNRFDKLKSIRLKHEQMVIIDKVCTNQNAIAQLTTGFGKSMIYTVTPLIMEEMARQAADSDMVSRNISC